MSDGKWIATKDAMPPEGKVVDTKISDPDRNEAKLVRKGGLFFFADMSMYAYYTPTHWRMP